MRTTAIRFAIAALAVGFFVTPIALRAVGVTAESFENRRLAAAPRLSQGWDAFDQTTRFLTDRMPLRAQAVRANTTIWTDIFATVPRYDSRQEEALPFARAIEQHGRDTRARQNADLRGPATASTGSDGWLYVPEEFSFACSKKMSNARLLQRWGRLVRGVRASGRQAALFVVPHKASVYPEHLPEKYPFDHCALEAKERLWRTLAKDGPALGVLELRSELLRLKADAGDRLFQRKDMHWTTLGALVLVDAALDALGDGVRLDRSEIVGRGSERYTGDLSIVGGRPETDTRMEYDVVRPLSAPRVPGRTLLVCDSFAYRWLRLFKPYFEDVRYISWYEDDRKILAAIRRSDRVIIEANELLLKGQATDGQHAMSVARELARPGS